METTLANLSPDDLEELITSAIDRRMEVWLTQLLDAIGDERGEDEVELKPEFEASLKAALDQAKSGDVMPLDDFRRQLFNE